MFKRFQETMPVSYRLWGENAGERTVLLGRVVREAGASLPGDGSTDGDRRAPERRDGCPVAVV